MSTSIAIDDVEIGVNDAIINVGGIDGSNIAPGSDGSTNAPGNEGSTNASGNAGSNIAPGSEGSTNAPGNAGSTNAPGNDGSKLVSPTESAPQNDLKSLPSDVPLLIKDPHGFGKISNPAVFRPSSPEFRALSGILMSQASLDANSSDSAQSLLGNSSAANNLGTNGNGNNTADTNRNSNPTEDVRLKTLANTKMDGILLAATTKADATDENANKDVAADIEAMLSNGQMKRTNLGHPREDTKEVGVVFKLFFLTQMFVNFDSGAIPSVLDTLALPPPKGFGLSNLQMGILGCVPYIGITFAAGVAGYYLSNSSQKSVLLRTLVLNGIGCGFLAFAEDIAGKGNNPYAILVVARVLIGMTQCPVIIYATVWVEEFAPISSKTLWVALLQVGVPLGVMFGYLVTGVLSVLSINWKFAILLQFASIWILAFMFLKTSFRYIDNPWTSPTMSEWRKQFAAGIGGTGKSKNTAEELTRKSIEQEPKKNLVMKLKSNASFIIKDPKALLRSILTPRRRKLHIKKTRGENDDGADLPRKRDIIKNLLWNRIYMLVIWTLSVLYFVVTGVQYWATIYLVEVFNPGKAVDNFKLEVVIAFALVAATGPATGVVLGGIHVDKLGGYNGLYQRIVIWKFLLVCCIIASGSGVAAALIEGGKSMAQFILVVILLWLLLAWGGAMVPALTGIMLNVVDVRERALASAFAQGAFNVIGFAAGTLAPSFFMAMMRAADPGINRKIELKAGMTLLFSWSGLGLLAIMYLLGSQKREYKSRCRNVHEVLREASTVATDEKTNTLKAITLKKELLEDIVRDAKNLHLIDDKGKALCKHDFIIEEGIQILEKLKEEEKIKRNFIRERRKRSFDHSLSTSASENEAILEMYNLEHVGCPGRGPSGQKVVNPTVQNVDTKVVSVVDTAEAGLTGADTAKSGLTGIDTAKSGRTGVDTAKASDAISVLEIKVQFSEESERKKGEPEYCLVPMKQFEPSSEPLSMVSAVSK